MNKDIDNVVIDGLDETFAENADVDEIEPSHVTLIGVKVDKSTSMEDNEDTMRGCLNSFKSAVCNSKQADEMLISMTYFSSDIVVGGYVAPEDINVDYSAYGQTKLYDAIVQGRQQLLDYMQQLQNNGTTVNACMVFLTDGYDVGSSCSIADAATAIKDLKKKEITVAFIAFGQNAHGIAASLGINANNVIEVSDNESELRRVMTLVSKSAISASKKASAGAGGDDASFWDV